MFGRTLFTLVVFAVSYVVAQSPGPTTYDCPSTDTFDAPLCFAIPAAISLSSDLECYYSSTSDLTGCPGTTANCQYSPITGILDVDNNFGYCPLNAVPVPPVRRLRARLNDAAGVEPSYSLKSKNRKRKDGN